MQQALRHVDIAEPEYPRLLSPFELAGKTLKNRIVHAAMSTRYAKDGEVTDRMSLSQWQMVIDVNLTGVFLCGREAATRMIQAKSEGVIINISSISRAGNFGQTNYSATKAGVAAMAVTWAKELARHNIRTGAIAPGFMATEMVASMKPEALEKMASGIPLKRLGEPAEIAQMAVAILENDYISGRVFEVDGGLRW